MFGIYNKSKDQIRRVFDSKELAEKELERMKSVPQNPIIIEIFGLTNPSVDDFENDEILVTELVDQHPDGGEGYAYKYLPERYEAKKEEK